MSVLKYAPTAELNVSTSLCCNALVLTLIDLNWNEYLPVRSIRVCSQCLTEAPAAQLVLSPSYYAEYKKKIKLLRDLDFSKRNSEKLRTKAFHKNETRKKIPNRGS